MINVENKEAKKKYIFVHLGARAHYQFPEAVSEKIQILYTDVWIPSNFLTKLLSKLPIPIIRKLLQRNNNQIIDDKVKSFPFSLLINELYWKMKGIKGWEKIIKRNDWFQNKVIKDLERRNFSTPIIMFAFAYTALKPLRFAKNKGWKTLLYQMDPGIKEEEIVKQELVKLTSINSSWQPAPPEYWQRWKDELNISDIVIVNSLWSKSALSELKLAKEKTIIIPLGIKPNKESLIFERTYPEKFTRERPLKVLFLGILTIRKGLRPLLEAISLLKDEPIEFTFVGTPETKIEENSQVKFVSSVSRAETAHYYKQADVFLFPTLSDGFGLTQLEALQWKLPIIASSHCGNVVQDNENGILLKEVTAHQIAEAIKNCAMHPDLLRRFTQNTFEYMKAFSIDALTNELNNL